MSDDGRHAITVIAFIGSVFSPFYFRSRDRKGSDPYNHPAMNVALYGSGRGQWAFTEYTRSAVEAEADSLLIGRNQLVWDGHCLACHIDERAAPVPRSIRGTVRLYPEAATGFVLALDSEGRHWWQPVLPRARIVVAMENPLLRWSGTGYLDCNQGTAPLDEDLRSWSWLRAHSARGTTIVYDITAAGGPPRTHEIGRAHV